MAYFRCIGGNGGGGGSTGIPQILDFEKDASGNAKTSSTTKTFSLNAGDTLIIAVMHRDTITIPTGFSQIAENSYNIHQIMTVIAYTATTAESKSVTITQASSARMAVYSWQMKNVSLSAATSLYKSGEAKSSVTLDNTYRPTLMVFSNVYTGTWSGSGIGQQLVFDTNNYTGYALNFGTGYSSTFSFTAGGNEWSTLGVYLTDQ